MPFRHGKELQDEDNDREVSVENIEHAGRCNPTAPYEFNAIRDGENGVIEVYG